MLSLEPLDPDIRYKPEFPKETDLKQLLTQIKPKLIDVFDNIVDNDKVAAWFESQGIIDRHFLKNHLNPVKETPQNWTSVFVDRISRGGEENIKSGIWRLCDPHTSGVSCYSDEVRKVLQARGVRFPQLQVPYSSTDETDPLSGSNNYGPNSKRNIWYSPSKQCMCWTIIIMGIVTFAIIILALIATIWPNETLANSSSTETTPSHNGTTLPYTEAFVHRDLASLKLKPSSESPAYSALNVYHPKKSSPESSTTQKSTSTTTTAIPAESTIRKPKISRRTIDLLVETAAVFEFFRYIICNETLKKRVILSGPNAYEFRGFNFSCASRIDGLSFHNSYFYIDEASSVLNATSRLIYLGFNGSSICIRNEGIRTIFPGSIYLPYLEKLEFENLRKGKNSTTDCTEIFSWAARINYKALKALSFSGVLFNEKNKIDIHELCRKAFNSRKLSRLSVTNAIIKDEMFNEIMPPRNFTGVKLYAKNFGSSYAQLSLFNMLNSFLRLCRIIIFESNIPLTYKQFRESLYSISKIGVERLKLSLYLLDCESLSFEFLHKIPNLHTLELSLIFSKECKKQAKSSPVKLERLQYLENSYNFSRFKIISNANFIAVGVSDLHCRDYRKNTTELTLNRSEDEDCRIN